MTDLVLRFEACLHEEKLARLRPLLRRTYAALDELAPWRKGKWPTRIRCMSDSKIVAGRKHGAGHGYTYTRCSGGGCRDIWLNPHMTWQGYWLVLVHENIHHSHPDASESEINCVLLPWVFRRVFRAKMSHAWARKHGVGSPEPGVGDRSYCR